MADGRTQADNLGFHVYREQEGELYRLTTSMVAGSAFLAGTGTALTAGRSYTWWDRLSPHRPVLIARASEVLARSNRTWSGKRTLHGPVRPVLSKEALPEKNQAVLLKNGLGRNTLRVTVNSGRLRHSEKTTSITVKAIDWVQSGTEGVSPL